MNPSARREYCSKIGIEFYLPPQYIPVQVPGHVAYNMNNAAPAGFGQPPFLAGYGQQPVLQGSYGQQPVQGGYAMTNFSTPQAIESNIPPPSYMSAVKQ